MCSRCRRRRTSRAARSSRPLSCSSASGFRSSELSTPVRDLSGGQKRRLQLLLVLLGEPNVLILDEPSNDLDTDMLAALEDLLDSWPGTLLVVSHDRYLIERVTDQQYAIENGGSAAPARRRRRVPAASCRCARTLPSSAAAAAASPLADGLTGADRRNGREGAQRDRPPAREADNRASPPRTTTSRRTTSRTTSGIGRLNAELQTLEIGLAALEERWLEVGESLGH